MTLKIISAAEIVFEGDVTSVTLPGAMGAFTVLRNHASLVAMLAEGTLRYSEPSGEESSQTIPGGVAEVDNNVVNVCVY